MDFIAKIEELINNLITRFTELIVRHLKKLTPKKVIALYHACVTGIIYVIRNFKTLPAKIKVWAIEHLKKTKTTLLSIDYKEKFNETYKMAQTFYKAQSSRGTGKLRALVVTPAMVVASWLQGLTTVQSIMLLALTTASFLSGIKIISSGQRIITNDDEAMRAPASEDEFRYNRPDYYKKDQRHVLVSNIRLPVYIGKVNELKSVDIDFTATVSNRLARMFLEKYEFQLRDHLILHIEPLIASFPLEEEGREMLRKKIWLEIDNFLKEKNVEGHVLEVKITYILAN